MSEFPGDDAALAATPGATLAAAREANGLSIIDVAEQMRISPRQVEAIEADRYDELPGAVFVRGFVRNYARLLRLDPAPLLEALEPAIGGDVPLRAHEIAGTLPEGTRRSHGRSWWWLIAVAVVLAALAALYEWWRARSGPEEVVAPGTEMLEPAAPKPPAPALPGPAQDAIPLAPERLSDNPSGPGAAVEEQPQQESATGASAQLGSTPSFTQVVPAPVQDESANGPPETIAPAPALAPAPAADETSPAAAGEGASSSVRMRVEVVADSWLEVRDGAGALQFSGTIPAGAMRSFEAQPPLDVVVGNASGVRVTYNEKPFDVTAHATRNIARFRLE